MCIKKECYAEKVPLIESPRHGFDHLINTICFHLNWSLPFYTSTIKKQKPQLVHAHFGLDGYRMIKPTQKTNTPLIVSFYGSDVSRLPNEFDWKRRYRKLANHGQVFIAATDFMKNQLINLGFPKNKIVVIRFGLDLELFKPNDTHSDHQPIMMVGRMVEKKGFIYALKAIKILNEQGYPYLIDLYGDGVLRPLLEEKVKKWNIEHLVHFHGAKPIDTIRSAYHKHKMLLVPSVTASDGDQEGIPNTLLEGMASGIPVIATNHAALPEAVSHKNTGLLVEEKNANNLAQAILMIGQSKVDLSSIRYNARKHIEENYGVDHMVKKTEEIYRSVIDKSSSIS